jgi:hypothetical protein
VNSSDKTVNFVPEQWNSKESQSGSLITFFAEYGTLGKSQQIMKLRHHVLPL